VADCRSSVRKRREDKQFYLQTLYWVQMKDWTAHYLDLDRSCRDLGTEACLHCSYGEAIAQPECDFDCRKCKHFQACPCSIVGWLNRLRLNEKV
jgi:hypothetical protein